MYPYKMPYQTKTDGTNSVPPQQWPLNQAAYQNVANDEVDWAALAAQWIYMKETCPYEGMPEAPPPPKISKSDFEEKGEAPMEVEKDDEHQADVPVFTTNSVPNLSRQSMFNDAESSSNWNTDWNPNQTSNWRKKPGWNTWTNPNIQGNHMNIGTGSRLPPSQQHQTAVQPPSLLNNLIDGRTKYWTPPGLMNSNDSFDRKQSSLSPKSQNETMSEQYLPALDAAKRKQLPAWIRQGLEKMEREKQKTAEKEREAKERLALAEQKKNLTDDLTSIVAEETAVSSRSKFDSDSDSDDESPQQQEKNREQILEPKVINSKIHKIQHKSKQELVQELMLVVRSSLTEILLEVTNEEIRTIASDTLARMRAKARKAKPVRKTALTSLTGSLGLGIYADSDNSGNSSSDESNDDNKSDDNDSDTELKEIIKRRKSHFETKAREIEASIAMEEEKNRRRYQDDNDDDNNDEDKQRSEVQSTDTKYDNLRKDIGEIQHENNIRSHGHRKDKKSSRFSDPTDTVKNLHVTHGSIIYDAITTTTTTSSSSSMKMDNNQSTAPLNTRATSYYENNKDSDSSSTGSNKASRSNRRRRKSQNSSSGDSENNDSYRKRYRSKDKTRRRTRSRSSSSERKYRSSYKKSSYDDRDRDRGDRDRRGESKESYKSTTSRDKYSRSYSNSSSRDNYNNRKRSRSRSPHKSSRKYY